MKKALVWLVVAAMFLTGLPGITSVRVSAEEPTPREKIEGYISEIESLNPARYTTETWQSLYNFMKQIKDNINDPLIDDQSDMIISQFESQMAALKELTGMEMIDVLLAEVAALNSGDYTEETWTLLGESIAVVEGNYDLLAQHPNEQAAAIATIKTQIAALVKVSDNEGDDEGETGEKTGKERVVAALAEVDALIEEDYTVGSWNNLQDNIEQFRTMVENNDPMLETYADTIIDYINTLKNALVDITDDYEPVYLEDGYYLLPLVADQIYRSTPDETKSNIFFVQRTALAVVEDGKVTVTIRVGGFEATKSVSVLKHEYYKQAKAGNVTGLKIGTKDILSEFDNRGELEGLGFLLEENNQYWKDGVEVDIDPNYNYGDITFELENIAEDIYLIGLSDQEIEPSATSINKYLWRSHIYFDETNVVKLPDSIGDGKYVWSFDTSNVFKSNTSTPARSDTTAKQELNQLLESEVNVTIEEGIAKAVFEWKDYSSIESAYWLTRRSEATGSSSLNSALRLTGYLSEDYEEIKAGDTFTLEFAADYKALVFGTQIKVKTNTSTNSYYGAIYLRAEAAEAVNLKDEDTGIEFLTDTYNVSKDSILEAEVVDNAHEKYEVINQQYATSVRKWKAWDIAIKDSGNNEVKISNNGELRLPVPEGYNTSQISVVYLDDSGRFEKLSGEIADGYFVTNTNNTGVYVICENKVYEDAENLEDGTYEVEVAVWNMIRDQASMANGAIDGKAKLVVKDNVRTLYLSFQPIHISNFEGYLSKMWVYAAGVTYTEAGYPQGERIPVTVIEYYKNADGSYYIDDFNKGTSNYYAKEVCFVLPTSSTEFPVRFKVPVMDAIAGGDFSQDARLRIDYASLVKVSDEAPETPGEEIPEPTEDVDKTELKAKLDEANALVTKTDIYSEPSLSALKAVIDEAQDKYDTPAATQTEITDLVNRLSEAIENLVELSNEILDYKNLPDGTYSVYAEMIKTNKTDYSMSNNAIEHLVKLTVEDGKYYITVDFKGLKISNYYGYLGILKYYLDGYTFENGVIKGEVTDAEILSYQKDSDGNLIVDEYNDINNPYPDILKFELVNTALNDEGGFVALQVFVPIMESISAGTGTQDVFMKLDWSTLKEATDDDFVSEEPEELSPAVDKTDPITGIKIYADTGVFPEGTEFYIKQITQGADYDQTIQILSDVGKKFKLYDISAVLDGAEVQPNGLVKISLPIPAGYDTGKLAVYRINDDGTKTLISGSVENGYYVFYVNHFSKFALVEKGSTVLDSAVVKTGDSAPIAAMAVGGLVSVFLAGAVVVTGKRKKEKN